MKRLGSLHPCTIAVAVLLLIGEALGSTGRSHEISNIHFENVTQTTVDVVWETAHPSTSLVLLAGDSQFEVSRWAPEKPDPALVTTHRVKVNRLFPGSEYFIYVVSVDEHGAMSTAPGPQTVDGKNPMMPMRTRPADTAAPTSFQLYLVGPNEVYAGHDLYFLTQLAQVSGPPSPIYVHNQHGYNNSSDGIVKYAGTGNGNPETISAHFSCAWSNESGNDSGEQSLDRERGLGYCYGNANKAGDLSFRVRTSPQTVPGPYSVSFTLEINSVKRTDTYNFNVLPAPSAPPAPQLAEKPIPGLGTWEKAMVALGDKWCRYRDQQNAAGSWVTSWGWTGDAWFYDGGRVFENIDSYTAAASHANHPYWQHCAVNILDPYASYLIATNGAMAGYSIFTYGMAMNYMRTHSQLMRDGIKTLARVGPQHVHVGYIDPGGIRENAYRSNAWMTDEMLGAPRSPLLERNIDKIMGQLNMIGDGKAGAAHPFMTGLGMETLIHWYDLNMAEGHPDYRVLPVIKEALDGLWRDSWSPKQNLFLYDRLELPLSTNLAHTALNNMVSVAYAWYWLQTGDTAERDRGDQAFAHAFDDPESATFSGKQFSQLYEFSFDFVRYRKGEKTSSVAPENNPYTGPYADTVPPITERVNCDPNYFPGCKQGSIGSTTAVIFWNTYKPATTQVVYGKSESLGETSPLEKAMTTSHEVKLTGLQPGTTYHFRVRSVDRVGNVAFMHDLSFKTLPAEAGKPQ